MKKGVDDPGTITLETAIERIDEKREMERNRKIKEFDNGIQVLNGRFGPYIAYNKVNYKIPKGQDATLLTLENCLEIIEKSGDTKKKTTKKVAGKAATETKEKKKEKKTSEPEKAKRKTKK